MGEGDLIPTIADGACGMDQPVVLGRRALAVDARYTWFTPHSPTARRLPAASAASAAVLTNGDLSPSIVAQEETQGSDGSGHEAPRRRN